MLRSMFRIFFALVISLSLAFGVFAGIGTGRAYAASQPPTAAGYNPLDSVPSGVDYCYPSGYNRHGWRCGWRLAQAPYNLGDYYRYHGYYGYYYYPYYGGYGGLPVNGYIEDYGGLPRYGGYYYYNCYNYSPVCYCYCR